ncbi:MAG TPA: YbaN family protein, partial [Burkholderiaceae bacterium]|nr:YbaN family protein [Burkholderiaceae bacterium]
MTRLFFNVVGTLAVILGLIGIFVPLLPTTPFLLLASACYMRGSQRMARWMVSNRLFGRYLMDFQRGEGIPLKTKIWALTVLWISLGVSAWVVPLAWVRPLL